ncbi:glycosyltransferase [uncultured Muriicola sp.]|uniref:glycosyltransferase n=1 Tax=uncultured Muriicola sp. TaxID=1583102 RepID=UPI00262D223F|nr:glycosyltransferase [uncultured Muriicola sp.]
MNDTLQKVLIIGLIWPEPDATAAGVRTLQIIQFFKEQGYHITFSSAAAKTSYSASIEALGIDTMPITLNHVSFDHFIKELKPQIVLFDRFLTEEHFGWRVTQHLPNTIRIIDTQDLHSLRKSREMALKEGTAFSSNYWLRQELTKRELASIFRSDLSLIISSFEIEWLRRHTPIDPSLLCYLPFVLNDVEALAADSEITFEERSDFVLIGNGKHAPNIDAIAYLKKSIWPLILKRLPEASLHIYGPYLPPKILALHNPKERFFVDGWVENAEKMMRKARVNLVPLRYGAGLKGKVFLAVTSGTPSVITRIGVEGTHLESMSDLIGTDANEFAQKAVALYQDSELWHKSQQQGYNLLRTHFDKKKNESNLIKALQILKQNLMEHRDHNIIGSMLMHHSMASTKYLSKWIALKQEKEKRSEDPNPIL